MRLFWTAWGLAMLLIVVAIAATAWVISVSDTWSLLPLAAARVLCVVFSLVAFVGAFRLALLGTASLRYVLAQNLAILIAMELDDLRKAAQHRASSLVDRSVATEPNGSFPDLASSSEMLQIPGFFGEREEIRKLLGRATEHTLEQVLMSLQSYNQTLKEIERERAEAPEARRQAVLQLRRQIGVVQDRVRQAASALAPFCRAAT